MSEPRWLIGGAAVLDVAPNVPTVWLVDLDEPAVRRRAETVTVHADDFAAFAGQADAGERLLRRGLARLLLAAAGSCRADAVVIDRTDTDAPVVAWPEGWHLSLAARWPLCLVGVARGSIGVDIETTGDPLPDDVMTEAERDFLVAPGLARGDDERRIAARLWAAKEAHAKWTGRPRDLDPGAIDTSRPPLVTSRFGATRCWLRDGPDHVAAVCTA